MKFIFLSSFLLVTNGTEQLIPRGIPISRKSLYDSLKDFTCFDGSLKIPFTFVNDDYCDCLDGSDEPGTSACPNGLFHCDNVGYIPHDIPASRVNDGVCDCCDASDEYLSDNCTDICHVLGAEAKKAAEKEAEIISQGNELRLQMILTGKQIRQQKQERMYSLEQEKSEASRLKDEASRLKQTAEAAEFAALEVYRIKEQELKEAQEKIEREKSEQEANNFFKEIDLNHDNILQRNELLEQDIFDQDKNGKVTEEDLRYFFNSAEEVAWDTFIGEVWPKIRILKDSFGEQEGTKDEVEAVDENHEFNDNDENYNQPEVTTEEENKWDYEENKNEDLSNREEIDEEEYEDEEEEKIDENEKQIENLDDNKPENKYDENTLKLIDDANKARSEFESAERSLQDIERELIRLKESLEKDYGPEDEYIPLDGQCFSFTDREYTYKLCPFDQVVQMAKSGGSETRLGVWAGWMDTSQYKVMVYDKGQACWNGPQRSTKVTLSCGLETAVVGAAEPNKCEYELILRTPAACKFTSTSSSPQQHTSLNTPHDEF